MQNINAYFYTLDDYSASVKDIYYIAWWAQETYEPFLLPVIASTMLQAWPCKDLFPLSGVSCTGQGDILQEIFHPLPWEELLNRFLLLPALNNLFYTWSLTCLLLEGSWSTTELRLSHHLPHREVVTLHLGFGARRWFGALSFELCKAQLVPQKAKGIRTSLSNDPLEALKPQSVFLWVSQCLQRSNSTPVYRLLPGKWAVQRTQKDSITPRKVTTGTPEPMQCAQSAGDTG